MTILSRIQGFCKIFERQDNFFKKLVWQTLIIHNIFPQSEFRNILFKSMIKNSFIYRLKENPPNVNFTRSLE